MSLQQLWTEFELWLTAAPAEFLFLLALPFGIAAVVLTRDAMRARRRTRRAVMSAVQGTAQTALAASPAAAMGMRGAAMPRILIPVDGSEASQRAVRHVVNQSLSRGGVEAHLLHVSAPWRSYLARFSTKQSHDARSREMAEQALAKARALLNHYSVPHAVHQDTGESAACIHRMAQRLRVDKIVMGAAPEHSVKRLFQDSVTGRVLDIAQVPVEVIAGGKVSKLERYGVPAGIGTALAALTAAVAD